MLIKLTEAMISAGASNESLARGRDYYSKGAIYEAAISENALNAKCRGSYAPHYQLRVEFDNAGVSNASCTCAYENGDYCKHIVALLLAYLNDPASFEPQIAPQYLLSGLNRDQMVELLTALIQKNDDVRNAVERWVADLARKSTTAKSTGEVKNTPQHKTVDDAPYRQHIRALIRDACENYNPEYEEEDGELIQELDEIRQVIVDYLNTDQSRNALAIATAVIDEIRKSQNYADFELSELDNFANQLDIPTAEAVLSTELSSAEKQNLQIAIGDDYHGYPATSDALEYGWTAIDRKSEHGNNDADEAGDDEIIKEHAAIPENTWGTSNYRLEDVNDAQLNVLNRRGENERYLAIALSARRHLRYTQKLIELRRGTEAVQYATQHFKLASEALALAQQLHAIGQVAEAIMIAGNGLQLAQSRAELGRWLAPLAKSHKQDDLALQALIAVFDENPLLPLFQEIKALADKNWDEIRKHLLEQSARWWLSSEYAAILLYEQEWDAAIAFANSARGRINTQVVSIIADGVMQHRPDWVVEVGKQHAQALIDTVSSSNYPTVAAWLILVKKAYRVLGQGHTWDAYLARIREDYRRRPSLLRALKTL